jgi:prepilin-type N-terminal cleavage/methylation domain-containing protein
MKSNTKRALTKGFTLIELLVVVAIIGALAALIVPSVQDARQQTRVTTLVADIDSVAKTIQSLDNPSVFPLTEHMADADRANNVGGANLVGATSANLNNALRLDQLLLSLGKLETLFQTQLVPVRSAVDAAGSSIATPVTDPRWNPASRRFVNTPDTAVTHSWAQAARIECATTVPGNTPGVDGRNFRLDGVTNLPTNARVQYAVLPNVTSEVAFLIGNAINTEALMDASAQGSAQLRGRAAWASPVGGLTTVYVYLGHQ